MDLDTVVGMWLLDEEKGKTALDSSGHERHGKHQGDVGAIDGRFGKGLELFGGGEGVVIAGLGAFIPAGSVTIMFWAHLDEWEDQNLFSMPVPGSSLSGMLNAPEKVIHFYCGEPAWSCIVPADRESWIGKWTHFAFVKNFSEDKAERYMAIYTNGAEYRRCKRVATLVNENEGDFSFGSEGQSLDGGIDELAIFSKALSEAKIKSIADRGLDLAVLAVNPTGKLATAWAALKSRK